MLGWITNDKYSSYLELKHAQVATHPEMYDTEGNLITQELTAVKVVLDTHDYLFDDED